MHKFKFCVIKIIFIIIFIKKPTNNIKLFYKILPITILLVLNLLHSSLVLSSVLHVNCDTGNDSYDYSQAQNVNTPWETIDHAADNAQAGDTIKIASGTYRESVTPGVSGSSDSGYVTFEPLNDSDTVIISAAEFDDNVLTSGSPGNRWSIHSGSIYKATLENTYFINDTYHPCVVVDGTLQHENSLDSSNYYDMSSDTLGDVNTNGDWYYDHTNQTLYLQWSQDPDNETILIVVYSSPINMYGAAGSKSYLRFRNIIFEYSQSVESGSWGGGTLDIQSCDHIILEGCSIRNSGGTGVLAYAYNDATRNHHITIDDCIVYNSWMYGIMVDDNSFTDDWESYLTIKNCEIYNNADHGIGICCIDQGIIQNNIIYGNATSNAPNLLHATAAGIESGGAGGKYSKNVTIQWNIVYNNGGTNNENVGAIAIYDNGASPSNQDINILNNVIYENYNLGIFLQDSGSSNINIENNTLVNNGIGEIWILTGMGTGCTVKNNIMYQDNDSRAPSYTFLCQTDGIDSNYNLFYKENQNGNMVYWVDSYYKPPQFATYTIEKSKDQNSLDNQNPLFVSLEGDDYHLQIDSPCRGAGENGVDIGAFPYSPTTTSIQSTTSSITSTTPDLYSISGTIKRLSNYPTNPIKRVTVEIIGQDSVTTDNDGKYTIDNLPDGASYEVIPTLSGNVLQPESRNITINGGSVTGVNFIYPWMQAEAKALTLPEEGESIALGIKKVKDTSGLGAVCGEYIELTEEQGGGIGKEITYEFILVEEGNHVIWGRVLARNTNSNSFLISIDGAPSFNWEITQVNNDWQWVKVNDEGNDIFITADLHTMTIKGGEAGTLLDSITVTNDMDYVPTGMGEVPPLCQPRNMGIWRSNDP